MQLENEVEGTVNLQLESEVGLQVRIDLSIVYT